MAVSQPELFAMPMPAANAAAAASGPARGRNDNARVAWEKEVLWPPAVMHLSNEQRVLLFGDIPCQTRLNVKQVCRRLNCDSNSVYRLIDSGALTAANCGRPDAAKATYLIYRWSLIEHIYRGLEGDFGQSARRKN